MRHDGTSMLVRSPILYILPVLLALPFLFVSIPPLGDVPGHMGRAAVEAYAPGDPALARLMGFAWRPVLNMGGDAIVALLQGAVGVTRAYWIVAAVIPVLLAGGILALARLLVPAGAASVSWALLFVYCYPFNFGFVNYMLGVAGALMGLVGWIGLRGRPGVREVLTWLYLPVLFLCHATAGCLFGLFIVSYEGATLWPQPGWWWRVVVRCRPLAAAGVILVAWRLRAPSFAGQIAPIGLVEKLNGVVMLLRDQNIVLDIASVCAAAAVFVVGWRAGARPHRAVVPAIVALLVLFVVLPPGLSDASYVDMRLLPLVPMLAFAGLDWRGVPGRLAVWVERAGLALLLVRLGVTAGGFVAYAASYGAQAQALGYIAPHSRVLVLTANECNAPSQWRKSRLGHFGDLAIVYRRSWTNSEWDIAGAHLLRVLYRPAPLFYDDPSEFVWPARCGVMPPKHRSIGTALALAPYDGLDDVWVIDAALPPNYANPRLQLRWKQGDSALFAVLPAPADAQHTVSR